MPPPVSRPGATTDARAVAVRSGAAVRRHRTLRGLSLRALAARVGASPATLSAIENGHTPASLERLHALAAVLGVRPALLLEPDERPDPGGAVVPTGGAGSWRRFEALPTDAVLDAAVEAFVAAGYHGTSMRAIAERAQLSVPGLYHHHRGKQALLARILDLTMGDLTWRLVAARDEDDDPLARLSRMVEALALFHTRRRDLAFIGASEMRSLEHDNHRRIARSRSEVQRLLDAAIADAVERGGLAARHPRDAGKAIATMCQSLPHWFRPGGPRTPEQVAAEYAELALRMLGHHGHAGHLGHRDDDGPPTAVR